jgi:tmRNA-binding protein
VGQLVKTLTDANRSLLAIQKDVKDLKAETQQAGPTSVTNALFVGNTTELQKIIKGRKNVTDRQHGTGAD